MPRWEMVLLSSSRNQSMGCSSNRWLELRTVRLCPSFEWLEAMLVLVRTASDVLLCWALFDLRI